MFEAMKAFNAAMEPAMTAPFGWPKYDFKTPPMGNWLKLQQEFVSAMAQLGQETMASAGGEIEAASGVMQRLMQAKTPEEMVACERDLFELMTGKYFEQMMRVAERLQKLFAQVATQAATVAEVTEVEVKKAA